MSTQTFVPREFEIFGGLDVDKKSIAITFMSHQGTLQSFSMPSRAEQLLNYVGKHFAGKKVAFAYEAGPTGWGLYDKLTAGGHLCVVAAPSMIPKVPGQRVKTNRLDSRKLSEHLRGGQLKSVHVPTGSYRQLRQLVQPQRHLCTRSGGDQASDQSDAAV
jgi:transposase